MVKSDFTTGAQLLCFLSRHFTALGDTISSPTLCLTYKCHYAKVEEINVTLEEGQEVRWEK